MTESVRPRFLAAFDLALLAVLVACGSWLTWRMFQAPRGGRAVVWMDGRRTAWYSLEGKPSVDTIEGSIGPLVVRHGEGEIRILEAPCPGKLCIRQGAARRVGEKLVCVPSHVVVSVEGDGDDDGGFDAMP